MKILHVVGTTEGHDYAALTFQNAFAGESAKKLIERVSKGETLTCEEDGETIEFDIHVVDTPDIVVSKELRNFIKNDVIDYDDGKHSTFYFEFETV